MTVHRYAHDQTSLHSSGENHLHLPSATTMQRLSSCSQPHTRGRFILEDFHLDLLSVFVLARSGIRHRRCDLEWPAGGAQSPCDCGRSRVEMWRTPSSTHVRCHLSPQSLGNLIVETVLFVSPSQHCRMVCTLRNTLPRDQPPFFANIADSRAADSTRHRQERIPRTQRNKRQHFLLPNAPQS